jgi:hypothetical protein
MRRRTWLQPAVLPALALVLSCSGDGPGANRTSEHPVAAPPATPPGPPPLDLGPTTPVAPPQTPTMPPALDAGASACGKDCSEQTLGTGGDGFEPSGPAAESVALDGDGALTVTQQAMQQDSFIWVSDTAANSISKIDTRTHEEVARYAVGAPDPSRTSVSMNGDAYVASRNGKGVTKISGAGQQCPDSNGDGRITTSTGATDVLPFGGDDCVLWFKQFDQEIRGVAAQDIPAVTEQVPQLDGPPKIVTTPEAHYVWVGLSTIGEGDPMQPAPGVAMPMAYKLDGATGEEILRTPMPRGAYGFALDGNGILWLTGGAYWNGNLAFIDTEQCIDAASCNVEPCRVTCSETRCPTTCDGAVKADITLEPGDAYGITVDCKQRVWLGGTMKRYDHGAAENERLVVAKSDPTTGSVPYASGIAADGRGWVWGASDALVRLDAETLERHERVALASYVHGVAVDADGQVWGITMQESLHLVMPGATITDNAVRNDAVLGLVQPYTYSDMTGVQLRLAAGAGPGRYRHVFEGCAEGVATSWDELRWDVETPGKSWVVIQTRSAETRAALDAAVWLPVTVVPATAATAQLATVLALSAQPPGRLLEIKIELHLDPGNRSRCTSSQALTPRVKSLTARHRCPPGKPGVM